SRSASRARRSSVGYMKSSAKPERKLRQHRQVSSILPDLRRGPTASRFTEASTAGIRTPPPGPRTVPEPLPMLLPLIAGLILLFCSLMAYALAMHLSVLVAAHLLRGGTKVLGFWRSTTVMSIAMLIAAAAHLTQIALWAGAFLLLGQFSTLEMAFY